MVVVVGVVVGVIRAMHLSACGMCCIGGQKFQRNCRSCIDKGGCCVAAAAAAACRGVVPLYVRLLQLTAIACSGTAGWGAMLKGGVPVRGGGGLLSFSSSPSGYSKELSNSCLRMGKLRG